jgi:hypothetical protein
MRSPTEWASEQLPDAGFGVEDGYGLEASMLGEDILYFRQMAYLETARVRLGGHPVFDYSFNMTHSSKS